jgi:hypothetical protein
MLRKRYKDHKASAKQRGIPFLLTYPQWLSIWEASGHLDERGPRMDQYCMARYGDSGAYEVGNVRIITCEDNIAEQEHIGHDFSAESKVKIGVEMKKVHQRRRALGLRHTSGHRYVPFPTADDVATILHAPASTCKARFKSWLRLKPTKPQEQELHWQMREMYELIK